MITSLLVMSALAAEPPTAEITPTAPDAELLAKARRQRTTGALAITGGTLLTGGGLAWLLIDRPPGVLSEEDPTFADIRTMSGLAMVLGGVTSVVLGTATLEKAARTRAEAQIVVVPAPVRGGGGLALFARF